MSLNGSATNRDGLRGKVIIPDKIHGLSAYEIAVVNGFVGTEQEWLESLRSDFEAERIKAERERVAAEKARAEAEAKRQAAFDDSIAHFDAERERAVEEFETEVNKLLAEEIMPDAEAAITKAANDALDATVEAAKNEVTYHTDQEKARATSTIDTKTKQALATLEVATAAIDTREVLLWTNPTPSNNARSITVPVPEGEYESYRILIGGNANDVILYVGESANLSFTLGQTSPTWSVTANADSIVFSCAYSSSSQLNIQPYKVYGIKNEKVELTEAMTHDALLMRDANTGTMYKLVVVDGKLTIEGVE